jgi:sugar/nucleoside kinase (ribokinase family)
VAFVGKVGADEFGRFMLRELGARGVDTQAIRVDPALKTGLTVILSRQGGADRALLTYAGSIAALHYTDLDLSLLHRARHLHLGGYFLLEALRPDVPKLFDAAHVAGLTVSLDTNYDPHEAWQAEPALSRVDIFLPNEAELLALTHSTEVEAALRALAISTIAIKLGEQGARARRGAETASASAIPLNAVDTTGAGDSFDAGFIYGYLHQWPLDRTLRLAAICGSLSTRKAGGTAAQATLAEALAYLK